MQFPSCLFFFFNDTATTEIYTLSPTRRSSDLRSIAGDADVADVVQRPGRRQSVRSAGRWRWRIEHSAFALRSEEHTSELQSRLHLVCRLLLEKKKKTTRHRYS